MFRHRKESCALLSHFQYLSRSHIALQRILAAFSTSGWKECHIFSNEIKGRLKLRVPEHASELLPNRDETNANSGQIWKFLTHHRKVAFCLDRKKISQMFVVWGLDSFDKIRKKFAMGAYWSSSHHCEDYKLRIIVTVVMYAFHEGCSIFVHFTQPFSYYVWSQMTCFAVMWASWVLGHKIFFLCRWWLLGKGWKNFWKYFSSW